MSCAERVWELSQQIKYIEDLLPDLKNCCDYPDRVYAYNYYSTQLKALYRELEAIVIFNYFCLKN